MFKDSDSPQSDYSSLCSWLNLPQSQELLALLAQQTESLKSILINAPVEGANPLSLLIMSEQTKGEIRGLDKARLMILARKNELEYKLNLKSTPPGLDAQEAEGNTQLN